MWLNAVRVDKILRSTTLWACHGNGLRTCNALYGVRLSTGPPSLLFLEVWQSGLLRQS